MGRDLAADNFVDARELATSQLLRKAVGARFHAARKGLVYQRHLSLINASLLHRLYLGDESRWISCEERGHHLSHDVGEAADAQNVAAVQRLRVRISLQVNANQTRRHKRAAVPHQDESYQSRKAALTQIFYEGSARKRHLRNMRTAISNQH